MISFTNILFILFYIKFMETFLEFIIILLITGAVVGFSTGLLGVGGGFLMVPIQFFLLQSTGISPDMAIRIAFGTSLAVILPTAISGSYRHYCNKCVLLKPAIYMGITGFSGGFIGGYIASITPVNILTFIFSILLFFVAYQILKYQKAPGGKTKNLNPYHLLVWGFLAGVSSGLLGIGGGVILVPVMLIVLGFSMLEAVGTSTVVILLTSVGGILSYIYQGLNIPNLPPYSAGYVNLLQFLLLSIFSIPLAYLGSYYAHKIPEKQLRYLFAVILIFIALKLSGLFELIGIPL